MFRTVLLSSGVYSLCTQQWYMSYSFRAGPGWNWVPSWSCSKAVYKPVWHIPLLSVQWIHSWWWIEELSKTCRVSCQNKFVKLVHLLLQSALQPLWVMACSTIAEYSQQEGFYRVPLPAARQTLNLEDQWLERFNSRHQVSPTPETTRANPSSGRWNYGRGIAENFAESGDFHFTFGFFYTP